jgi:hypothetical protein
MLEETWFYARQLLPGSIVRCEHGTNPVCKCVRWFNVDKTCSLTKRQVIVAVASFELNKMVRLGIDNDEKYNMLTNITQCKEGEEDAYIEEYKLHYDSLLPRRPSKILKSDPPPDHNRLIIVLIISIMIALISIGFILYY